MLNAPLENGRPCAGDPDVIVVMDHCASVAFMKKVMYPLPATVPTLRSKLHDNTGRMCVWFAVVHSCVIGSRAVADVFAT